VPLIDGGTVRLPRIVGQGRALDMILTGRAVKAEEALAWGLADRVVPASQALAAAQELAQEITRFPQTCMRTDRASALNQWSASLEAALGYEAREGLKPLMAEALSGAAKFAGGLGRGGDFGAI
jgi:enoyl-CoA hydratase